MIARGDCARRKADKQCMRENGQASVDALRERRLNLLVLVQRHQECPRWQLLRECAVLEAPLPAHVQYRLSPACAHASKGTFPLWPTAFSTMKHATSQHPAHDWLHNDGFATACAPELVVYRRIHTVRQHVPMPPLLRQVPEVVVPAYTPRIPLPCRVLVSTADMLRPLHSLTRICEQVQRQAAKSAYLSCRSCCSSDRLTDGSEAPGRPSTRGLSFSTCTHDHGASHRCGPLFLVILGCLAAAH